ncbi:MAG: flagellar basal-body MS-ring/collar protein FliF [Ruegeria sp.]
MQQILGIWSGLEPRKRLTAVVAAFLVVATIVGMSRIAARPNMALLYAGLDDIAAGEVVRALEQQNVAHMVKGGSIYVSSRTRDALRMTLAADGLPATGGRGYELLDGLSGFGTTSQMFDAAYWRAKEGELARTIVDNPRISQARVHIANGATNPFQRGAKPTASVSIISTGGQITTEQAQALRFLVASAVAGMDVDDVAVIDAKSGVIGAADDPSLTPGGSQDRSNALREKVLRLVEARVGRGNAVVEVTVDTVTETESIRERRIDPNGRVAISTDTEERSNTASETGSAVTVASNLPDGDAANGGTGTAETSEVRERVNYEVSEVEREVLREPGAIKRLTIAVLVNDLLAADPTGEARYQTRPAEELDALRDLVASAVGYDETRGDVITIKSMELPSVAPDGTSASNPFLDFSDVDVMQLVQMAILALVALGLSLFVVRPILSGSFAAGSASAIALPPMMPANHETRTDVQSELAAIEPAATQPEVEGTMVATLSPEENSTLAAPGENAAERLRALISERQTETIEILRSWLEDEEHV